MRKCVIMPLFGISGEGSLGECAYCFADRVAEIGAGYWLLPSLGENYADGIDLELLSMDGLLTHAEIEAAKKNKPAREKVLRKAFARFWKPDSYAEFERTHRAECADDYELFLRYEFSVQYNALTRYALSRGVTVTDTLPQNVEIAYLR